MHWCKKLAIEQRPTLPCGAGGDPLGWQGEDVPTRCPSHSPHRISATNWAATTRCSSTSRCGPSCGPGFGRATPSRSMPIVPRAPLWMRKSGLEWIWRLRQEPGRMWRRHLLGNFNFLARIALQPLGLRRPATDEVAQAGAQAVAEVRAIVFANDMGGGGPSWPAGTPLASLPLGHQRLGEYLMDQLSRVGSWMSMSWHRPAPRPWASDWAKASAGACGCAGIWCAIRGVLAAPSEIRRARQRPVWCCCTKTA